MERIAIISDIHGNLEALQTVLKDIEQRNISRIFCLGDIVAKGVHSHECLALLRKKCEVILRGNCDRYFSQDYSKEQVDERIAFNHRLLTKSDREYLIQLPFSFDFTMSGSLIRLYHATPWADNQFIGMASSEEQTYQMFLPTKYTANTIADVVVYGHTHTPYVHKAYHHTLINAGSVGNNIEIFQDQVHPGHVHESNQATYLIIEGNYQDPYPATFSYTMVRIPYDIEKELASPIENPEKEAYEDELRLAKYRDIAKIKVIKK